MRHVGAELFSQALTVAALSLLGLAVFDDLKRRILPNRYTVGAAVCGLIVTLSSGEGYAGQKLLGVILGFFALWLLVERGWLGGGDAKMIPSSFLLVPLNQSVFLIYAIVLTGGVVALAMYAARAALGGKNAFPAEPIDKPINPWSLRDQISAGVPYGIAIWAGLALTLAVHR